MWSEVGEQDMCERIGSHPVKAIKSEKQFDVSFYRAGCVSLSVLI